MDVFSGFTADDLVNVSYEDAVQLSRAITDAMLDQGSCRPGDVRTCVELTATTKSEIKRFHDAQVASCAGSGFSVPEIYGKCLKFDILASSYYIAAGSLAFEHNSECVYESLDFMPWSTDTGNWAKHLGQMAVHEIRCTKDLGTQLAHGFVAKKRLDVYQKFHPDDLVFRLKCANDYATPGTFKKYRAWYGAVEVGVHAIVVWCRDHAYEAQECWEKVIELFAPIKGFGTSAMSGFSNAELYDLGQEVIEKAYDGTLDFQEAFSKYEKNGRNLKQQERTLVARGLRKVSAPCSGGAMTPKAASSARTLFG